MAKFVYRMQSILDVKEKLEEQAKNEFAKARIHLDEEIAVLDKIKARRSEYEEEGRILRQSVLDIKKLTENQYAIDRMDEAVAAQEIEVQKAQKELDKASANLVKAMQETKIQNKLKEKAFEQFKKDLVAQEMKEVDELTSYTYGQKA